MESDPPVAVAVTEVALTDINLGIPSVILSSSLGNRGMPVIGMGTACDPSEYDVNSLKRAILDAIEVGYRHFDAAPLYRSEQALGEAILEALHLGLVHSRNDLFITTKLWCNDAHHDHVTPALKNSLGSVWAGMEECQRLGLTKSIGVCNFSCKKLQDLLILATIPPSVNQVEMSPVWQQRNLREFCAANNIVVMAYSPLGAKGARWGTNQVMDSHILNEIGNIREKTVAQVSLKWVYEQGVTLLVKSFKKERMKENLKIFDWELSEEDNKKINQIPQCRGMPKKDFVSRLMDLTSRWMSSGMVRFNLHID
ncbi:NADPH-dependent codeinone reductase-like protein [Quillaja saponaria]|uniref:NADPH-dependent codeinone reductase-like protein n=1 Tax=Quillaja saponaria TaxID=32244 RepID=A0AAD7PFC5_QUISA|nr:NADPH-dependent codeinone reductase-like protein [Quillaja saponaria]